MVESGRRGLVVFVGVAAAAAGRARVEVRCERRVRQGGAVRRLVSIVSFLFLLGLRRWRMGGGERDTWLEFVGWETGADVAN